MLPSLPDVSAWRKVAEGHFICEYSAKAEMTGEKQDTHEWCSHRWAIYRQVPAGPPFTFLCQKHFEKLYPFAGDIPEFSVDEILDVKADIAAAETKVRPGVPLPPADAWKVVEKDSDQDGCVCEYSDKALETGKQLGAEFWCRQPAAYYLTRTRFTPFRFLCATHFPALYPDDKSAEPAAKDWKYYVEKMKERENNA